MMIFPPKSTLAEALAGAMRYPLGARLFMPASIERSVWEYFSVKAEERGVDLSELLTEVLKRDIEISAALR